MIMLFNGDLYSLLNFLSFARWLFIGLVVAGLIYLRYKRPDMPRPFKVTSALYSFTWILPPLCPAVRQQGSIFWCHKLTSFSGKTNLRGNSVCSEDSRVFLQGPQCYPSCFPFWKRILACSLCLGGSDWSCCAEMKVFAQFCLSVVLRLCDVSSVMQPVWKYLETSAVTEGSDCKYWGYMCQTDFQPVFYLMSPLIKAGYNFMTKYTITWPKSHVKHKDLWEMAFTSLHIQY